MSGPLTGIKVVELTDGLGGAFAGKLFAGLGAEVLLVERPHTGSHVRWQPPFLNDVPGADRSGLFLYLGAGKRSLTLDTTTPDGQHILARLLSDVDMVIEDRGGGTHPGSAGEEDVLRQAQERTVLLTLRPFSPGPYSDYRATELQMTALGGWMIQVGEPDRTPLMTSSVTVSALVPGLLGAIAALATLLTSDGGGGHLDLSAHESLLFCTRFNETYYSYTGTEIKRYGRSFAGWSPTYRIFDSADGYVTSAASTDAQVELLMALTGVEAEFYATREMRYQKAQEFVEDVGVWFKSKTRDEAFHECQEWRIPVGKVSLIDELVQLEQLVARQFFVNVDHPVIGKTVQPGNPARFSATPAQDYGRAPLLGEHTIEILKTQLDLSPDEVVVLGGLGVI